MLKEFYVYTHAKPHTIDSISTLHDIFYVGKGSGRRLNYVDRKHNAHHSRIVAKYGKKNIIIRKIICYSEQHAFDTEVLIIKSLRKIGVKLCNHSDGGEGVSNPSAEVRLKMSIAKRGRKLTQAHKEKIASYVLSAESREKISKALKGRKKPPRSESHIKNAALAQIGKKWSDEHREKMRLVSTGKKHTEESKKKIGLASKGRTYKLSEYAIQKRRESCRKVFCVTTNQIFKNIYEAAEYVGVTSAQIIRCCNGSRKTAKKMTFTYLNN